MILRSLLYFYQRKILPGFKAKKYDVVIDIGSGDKPFWRANVFLDNLSLDNLQRSTYGETIKGFGNFVDGDITKTKFKDKVFDFSFCSHVLEHVENPDLAIKEIMRISKAGYIEVPNGLLEYMKPFSTHLWFIFLSNKKLYFLRKSSKLHEVLTNNSINYSYLPHKVRDPFIRLYWKNKIEYEIIDICNDVKQFTPSSFKNLRVKVINEIFLPNSLSQHGYLLLIKVMRKVFQVNTIYQKNHLFIH